MAIFRPVKKWLLPLLCIVFGGVIGFSLFPSKEDHTFNQWIDLLEVYENDSYDITSTYKWNGKVYSKGQGVWSKQQSYYQVLTPVSNGEDFSFEAYVFDAEFYLNSEGQWFFGNFPHRFTEELAPLDNPFTWTIDLLKYAEHVEKSEEGDYVTYNATFMDYPSIDFRGTLLREQENTYLEMTLQKGALLSLDWVVNPIHPDSLGPLVSYPKILTFELTFDDSSAEGVPDLPGEAESAEEIE